MSKAFSHRLSFLRIGGIHGDRIRGMQEMQMAAENGHYLRPLAKILLALASEREHQMDRAQCRILGFPIGGVAAFDPDEGGVISAGGVGFDISCGVRALQTGLTADHLEPHKTDLADALFRKIPAGVGSTGAIQLGENEMDEMLRGGAQWAVARGYGIPEDLERIEEGGSASDAKPECVSQQAKKRQAHEMGTLGSGNHYLEVQRVAEIFDSWTAPPRYWGCSRTTLS